MTLFARQLHDAGYTLGTEAFYDAVTALLMEHYPQVSDEQLKREPREALRFCTLCRETLGLPALPDRLILGGLENHRKKNRRMAAV